MDRKQFLRNTLLGGMGLFAPKIQTKEFKDVKVNATLPKKGAPTSGHIVRMTGGVPVWQQVAETKIDNI